MRKNVRIKFWNLPIMIVMIAISTILALQICATVLAADASAEVAQSKQKLLSLVQFQDAGTGENVYADYYGGAYINDEKMLVVQLCGTNTAGQETIRAALGSAVLYEYVERSYQSLTEEIETGSALLQKYVEERATGELGELTDNIVSMYTDVKRNANVVCMKDISEEMQLLYYKYFGGTGVIFEKSEVAPVPTASVRTKASVRKKISMYSNMVKMLKAGGASSQVTWTSSNTKLLKIAGTRGENRNTAVIRTTGKTGTCKVTAVTGEKTYVWKLTVKSDKRLTRMRVLKTRTTGDSMYATVKILNRSNKVIEWDETGYTVEKLVDGRWKECTSTYKGPQLAYVPVIAAKSSRTFRCLLAKGVEIKSMTPGLYRIRQSGFPKKSCAYALFTIL